jgi:hypothetical protein
MHHEHFGFAFLLVVPKKKGERIVRLFFAETKEKSTMTIAHDDVVAASFFLRVVCVCCCPLGSKRVGLCLSWAGSTKPKQEATYYEYFGSGRRGKERERGIT